MYDGRVVYYHGGEQTYAGVSLHGEAGRTNMKQRKRLHLHWQNVGLVIMENQKFSISAGLTCASLHLDKDQLLGGNSTPRQRDNSGKLTLNQTYDILVAVVQLHLFQVGTAAGALGYPIWIVLDA